MRQLLQDLRSGEILFEEVPYPAVPLKGLIVETAVSLVSVGTERMLLQFGKANLLEKARHQPDRLREAWEKIKVDGIVPTAKAIASKLNEPIPMGYCNAGFVRSVGAAISDFKVGDRVVSNGPHAEIISVPRNLCARIPDAVSFEAASFSIPGAIGLHGIRLLQPTLGECIGVIGLGLIGLLSVQILGAHGCRVVGIDLSSAKCALANGFGATAIDLSKVSDPLPYVNGLTQGYGLDAVLITASTDSNEPVHQAAQMCRKRGRIVLVGSTGLELRRSDFYEKEISFQVSCSYGPGRYDPSYEDMGCDYPIGYVRWTEKRNFEAILNLMDAGRLQTSALVSHRFPFPKARQAYDLISTGGGLGITLQYDPREEKGTAGKDGLGTITLAEAPPAKLSGIVVGVIGAGGFTGRILLPAIRRCDVRFRTIASSQLVNATRLGKQFGFERVASQAEAVLSDSSINTVLITSRHNRHAEYVIAALQAGKRVFVEKPLCITFEELAAIENVYHQQHQPFLMVGFNRRFAPHVVKMKQLLEQVQGLPKAIVCVVNASRLPREHWGHDPLVGGGMIMGEGCHFIDLLRCLIGHKIVECRSTLLGSSDGYRDTATISLKFEDGSIGTVHYFATGHKKVSKERLEIFCAGRVLLLDNYRKLSGFGWRGFSKLRSFVHDKGHISEMQRMVAALRDGNPSPIPFAEIVEISRNVITAGGLSQASLREHDSHTPSQMS